uniref:Uncharacterized protein n=1 Tax=Rhizophora mucronata TaxID=61149 RepID=A0A2P2PX01_RHIMU
MNLYKAFCWCTYIIIAIYFFPLRKGKVPDHLTP